MKLSVKIFIFAAAAMILPAVLCAQKTEGSVVPAKERYNYANVPEIRNMSWKQEHYKNAMVCRYYKEGEVYDYDYVEYMEYHFQKSKGETIEMKVIEFCCNELGRCYSEYFSLYDSNTMTLAAAQYNSLPALKFFVNIKGFQVDWAWRWDVSRVRFDLHGRSELMHAIANNNLDMVKFLLGKEEGGNKIQYSNPRRRAPHPKEEYFFKHDARDFARWHRDKYPKGSADYKTTAEIIRLVEESWNESGEYVPDAENKEFYEIIEDRQRGLFVQNTAPSKNEAYERLAEIKNAVKDTNFMGSRPSDKALAQLACPNPAFGNEITKSKNNLI